MKTAVAADALAGRAEAAGLAAKRALDVAAALAGGLLLLPLLLLVAILVRVESEGPALFAQERIGRGGAVFKMWKFRTMRWRSDDELHREASDRWLRGDMPESGYKLVDDPRVTRVGRVLRRLSLDELPQLLNVLRGEMALVGPRPMLPDEVERLGPLQAERHAVRPGVTGLWQVTPERYRLSVAEVLELDLAYVRGRSLLLDLSILLRTPGAAFARAGRSLAARRGTACR